MWVYFDKSLGAICFFSLFFFVATLLSDVPQKLGPKNALDSYFFRFIYPDIRTPNICLLRAALHLISLTTGVENRRTGCVLT